MKTDFFFFFKQFFRKADFFFETIFRKKKFIKKNSLKHIFIKENDFENSFQKTFFLFRRSVLKTDFLILKTAFENRFLFKNNLKTQLQGMFSNCFFSLFSVSKNNFLFLKIENLFGNPKWTENKNYSQNSIFEGN